MRRLLRGCVPLVAGLLFGIGLMVSGMVVPAKVQAFLDVGGRWDPSLALVMGGAIGVALPIFRWAGRRRFPAPPHGPVDGPLVVGSLVFGIGWGLSGYCPGPALLAAGGGNGEAMGYVFAMGLGMILGTRAGAPDFRRA
ncbi:MAG: YeeE/YedE family protein [Zoogloea sp.]|nr:YeeE/YedE family protein [Zoogloea sp.]